MAHVEDRWVRRGQRTARYGTGLRYRVRYIDADGRERSESFPDRQKGAAERFKIRIEAALLQGTYLDPDAGKITLRAYSRQWRESRTWDAATRETVGQRIDGHILPGLGDRRLDQLARSPSVVSGWLAGLPVGARYAGQCKTILSSILSAAVDDGRIARNPCSLESVRAPRVDRTKIVPWPGARVAAVRAGLPPRWQAVADCGSGLGLRQGEAFGLPVPEVNWLRRSVHVRVQVRIVGGERVFAPPKGGRVRDVPLPGPVSLALAAHLERFPARSVTLPWLQPGGRPRTETLVFTSAAGEAVHRNGFNAAWRQARMAAGVPNVRQNGLHALRHYYASVLLAGGVDIEALSVYLGHHDPSFTLRTYAHLRPAAEARALRAIEAAFAADLPGADGPETAQGTGGQP
jgi:integrase